MVLASGIPFSNDLISFEEITDYEIINGKVKTKKKAAKRKVGDDSGIKKKKSKKLKKEEIEKIEQETEETIIESDEKKDVKGPKKVKKIKKKKNKLNKKSSKNNSTSQVTMNSGKTEDANEIDEEELYKKMNAWTQLYLPKTLLIGLYKQGFYEPTNIQRTVVPSAIKDRMNIIGAAQTGSGKTLAFGLPILARLYDSFEANINDTNKKSIETSAPIALILTPTRELAIQIKQHLQICAKFQKTKVVVVVGGISQLKQERLLRKMPEIVVATPGRLMQMIDEGNEYLSKLNKIRFLVIDEADRMIEKQHYNELERILELVNSDEKCMQKRQNFLFSATLITSFKGNELKKKEQASIDLLINKIQMNKDPKIVDLTTKAVTAETLFQTKIFCTLEEKDIYLYYFISKYVGRTLVFANSIDCVRRLTNLFRLLNKEPLHLHANMNQKQRCKNLEKYYAESNGLLIASDVAARGLDIPGVMHVIHYQVPRSTEIYIHRSGRTARSQHEGLSVLLVSPNEMNLYRKILQAFKADCDLKEYPIDLDYFSECKKRVQLSRKINDLEHQISKEKSNTNWYEKNAKLMDIDLDDEIKKETHIDTEQMRKKKSQLKQFKGMLNSELKKLVMPKFFSKSYVKVESIEKFKSMNNRDDNAIDSLKTKTKNNLK